jgi:hypothetical protein
VAARLQAQRQRHHWMKIAERADGREYDSPLAVHYLDMNTE